MSFDPTAFLYQMTPKIYFAGRIVDRSSWSVVNDAGELPQHDPAPTGPTGLLGRCVGYFGRRFIYTGPFYDSERCCHAVGPHNECGNRTPEEARTFFREADRSRIFKRSLEGVRAADWVFAWLDTHAYGTCVEVGYAHGLGKKLWVAGPPSARFSDLWFPYLANDHHLATNSSDDTPQKAITSFLDAVVGRAPVKPEKTPCEPPLESPIEEKILQAFLSSGFVHEGDHLSRLDGTSVRWQVKLLGGKYRADFVVGRYPSVVVECDGHEHHEKTKEQAQRDKKRDRELTAAGLTVLHFTGSEIHRDAKGCVKEVLDMLESLVARTSKP